MLHHLDLYLIFDCYKQASLEENKYISGTGLGLSIVKQLAELLDRINNALKQWPALAEIARVEQARIELIERQFRRFQN